jgi:CXXX repeat modification system protein
MAMQSDTIEVVGRVSADERNQIQELLSTRYGLMELLSVFEEGPTAPDEKRFFNKVNQDLKSVSSRLDSWWASAVRKHHWRITRDCQWQIDFETGEISLLPR